MVVGVLLTTAGNLVTAAALYATAAQMAELCSYVSAPMTHFDP